VLALAPSAAAAHDGAPPQPHDLWGRDILHLEPVALLGIAVAGLVYGHGVRRLWRQAGRGRGVACRQASAFAVGLVVIAVALLSPLDRLAGALLWLHMVQHLLLIGVGAALVVLGAPATAIIWALPRRMRRGVGRWRRLPALHAASRMFTSLLTAWLLHAGALWLWHLPAPYQAALRHPALHAAEHAAFLGTALLFWWAVVHAGGRSGAGHGAALIGVFTMALAGGVLGALMTFAGAPWYPAYAATAPAWGLTALEDQQIAGLVMWMPGGLVYALAAVLLVAAWLRAAERRIGRHERQFHLLEGTEP
jgi:putative membrane protein